MNTNGQDGERSPHPSSGFARLRRWRGAAITLVFLVLVTVLAFAVPNFLGLRNIEGLLLSVSLVGTIATTTMLVLALGEVDLSVASIVALAGVVAALTTTATGSVAIGVACGVAAGAAVGVVNGVLVAHFGVSSLIATLASMEIVRGLAYIASRGDAVAITVDDFFRLGSSSIAGVAAPIWVAGACFLVFGVLLNFTVLGRDILAIGGNAEAARLAGVRVVAIKVAVFALQGTVAGLAGVLLASRMSLGDPKTSLGLELAVISACVLGGVSLTGGIATVSGVLVGVLLMGTVQNAMNLMNVPTFYQYVIRGGILLIAVLFDQMRRRRLAR